MSQNRIAQPGVGQPCDHRNLDRGQDLSRADTEGRAYYRRKLAAGKTPMEALRALKRRLSDIVYKRMVADAKAAGTGPGGQAGATLQSSADGPIPTAASSDKSQPGPATKKPRTNSP